MTRSLLLLALLSLSLSNCASTGQVAKVQVTTTPISRNVTIQPHPRAVQLKNPKWYVITDKNYNDFKKKFLANNKDFVVYGVSPEDFKKLLNNQAELLRYIRQQNATILYYEKTVN